MAATLTLPEQDLDSAYLRIAVDSMPVAVSWASLADQAILYTNRAFQDLFGYEPGRFKTIAEWVETTYPFAEDRALAWERWGAYFATPTQCEFPIQPMELRILCHNGVVKTVLHAGTILPETGRAVATFTDITGHQGKTNRSSSERKAQETEAVCRMLSAAAHPEHNASLNLSPWEALIGERHRQREALRISEELLDRTGQLAGVGGWDIDLLTGIVTWTAETHRLHAVPLDYQPTLETGINFYAPEARDLIARVVSHATITGEGWDVEAPLIRADGQRIWVRVLGTVEFADGKPVRLIGAFQDITCRVNEQKALKLANERLVLATASGHIATWDWDITNDQAFWDDRMYGLYGLDPSLGNASYETWAARIHPEDLTRAAAAIFSAVETAEPYEDEFRVLWPDGSLHHIRARGQASHDQQGKATRLVGVNWDVTEQLRLAADALKANLKMKDEFLSHVSHELRSPLASIYSFAGILADGLAGEITPAQAEYLEIILRNSRQLRSMIDDLLQVTQSETGKLAICLEETSLGEAIVDALNTTRGAAESKWIALTGICDPTLPHAFADPIRMRQVLIIILDNAIKFTPAGGFIELRARTSENDASLLEVSITDSGPGIDPSAAKRIFEHLYQVDAPGREGRNGLGLGLYIARGLVHRHGGSIWVESQPGKGSTFRFTVPIFTPASQATGPWGVERRVSGNTR